MFVDIPWSAVEIPYDGGDLKLNVSHDALFLQEATHSSKDNFFQNWRNFDNFQCIAIPSILLQSESTNVSPNGERQTSKLDLNVSIVSLLTSPTGILFYSILL